MESKPFHDTLSQALDAAFAELRDRGAEITAETETEVREGLGNDGVKYNETRTSNLPLESLKGKTTKKWGHVTIYRMETGRYEQNNYIL